MQFLHPGILNTVPAGGGGGGITRVGGANTFLAYNAASPATLAYTVVSTSNVIVARIALESNGTSLDSSIDIGGGQLPTFGGTGMTFGALGRISRRHAGIYVINPASTGSQTFSIAPTNGIRSIAIKIDEYSGVDTTTILNNVAGSQQTGDSMAQTITTTDADGVIVGVVAASDETVAITMTTPSETIDLEGQTGAASQDLRAGFHDVDVASAAATEGLTFNQTGNLSAGMAIAELNPA